MRVELIAELATNHGGSVALAKEFIDRFAEAGADWIKLQYTRTVHLNPSDVQFGWFRKSELQDDQFAELKAYTEAAGAKFLLTVYNHQDVPAVRKLCDVVKIGSGEKYQTDLLQAVARAEFERVIVSGHFVAEWDRLACVARYPTPEYWALRLADQAYGGAGLYDGWSDHVIGAKACEIAILRGAKIIEKHVQLEHQARPPRPFEATVSEFKYLRTFADNDPELKFKGRWQFNG